MPTLLQSLAKKGSSLISPIAPSLGNKGSGVAAPPREGGFEKAAKERDLFPVVDPAVDGEECLRDCESCTIRYPSKFKIDEEAELYGWVKGWSTHLLVATGKTDWVRDVEDEVGSVMEGVGKAKKPTNGVSFERYRVSLKIYTACGFVRSLCPFISLAPWSRYITVSRGVLFFATVAKNMYHSADELDSG